ncbi:hypothetical protein [Nocardia sp. CA-119907]
MTDTLPKNQLVRGGRVTSTDGTAYRAHIAASQASRGLVSCC